MPSFVCARGYVGVRIQGLGSRQRGLITKDVVGDIDSVCSSSVDGCMTGGGGGGIA
jgi:hypothetical protein